MIKCQDFAELCRRHDLTFFTGVPDSTFKSWMAYLESPHKDFTNVAAVNECEATAVAAGYHLASGKPAVLYLQNSGLGKTVNPLTSLCGPEVYNIPLLMMIGWRGEPGKKEAHQHRQMGVVTPELLELLGIPYQLLPEDITAAEAVIKYTLDKINTTSLPAAVLVRKGIFEPLASRSEPDSPLCSREKMIKQLLGFIDERDILVSTTGKTSRELNEAALEMGIKAANRFYNPGAMGCAPSIALGISLQKPDSRVFVMDGDGALLMQMGVLATIGKQQPANFHHIVFDNQAHESTGGQPTNSDAVNFRDMALASGYRSAIEISTTDEIDQAFGAFARQAGPNMLIVKIKIGSRSDLTRPADSPIERKQAFMRYLDHLK